MQVIDRQRHNRIIIRVNSISKNRVVKKGLDREAGEKVGEKYLEI